MKGKVKKSIALGLAVITIVIVSACTSSTKEIHARKIIFLVGDGMGLNQVFAAYTANGGSLALEGVTYVGLQKNQSASNYITDSGASGTALACGQKTRNGMIGMDSAQNELESILKFAEKQGMSTGLVSTSALTHATPAAFIANEPDRNNYEAIAADFLETDIDVMIGGGLDHFTKRADGRDLTVDLTSNGYDVLTSMEDVSAYKGEKLAAFTAPMHNPRMLDGRGDMLPEAGKKALELLNRNKNGFFIMIEGSEIDWGAHDNNQEYMVTESLDFDAVVRIALDFARLDGETLVVVTGDHETGGMVVLNGDISKRQLETVFTTGGHTGVFIPVFAYGPGSQLFTGIYENSDFKAKFIKALGF